MAAGAKPKLQVTVAQKATPGAKAAPAGAAAGAKGGAAPSNSNNCLIPGPPPPPPPSILTPPKAPPPPSAAAPVPAAPKPAGAEVLAAQVTEADTAEELDPIEAEKAKLMENPAFARLVKLHKMKVPMKNILLQLAATGFGQDDIMLFAGENEIASLKK
tara:strand:- start:152 stop:628 length:477 start_codon:yes stop_codon:yes gene_type:complete